ncbi:MAG: O-antigen ligase family protein, partial [Anaerolineales bacterium]|nr:O-antigen ligase family protein [Anaerolineales bacterium]
MQKSLKLLTYVLMAGLFLSLPMTNFPFFPASFGGDSAYVRPLLVYPLLGLVILMTLPRLISKTIPRPTVILTLFFIWALVVSIIPLLRGVESPWREISLLPRETRIIITLLLGLAIYYTVSLFPQTIAELRFSLKWVYAGLGLALTWGSLQALYIIDFIPGWFEVMVKLQKLVTIRKLNPSRVTGMTYEPSAFADQLVVIWLPLVLGASLEDYTVFKWRWKWITVEKILFVWTIAILAFTLSRTGLIFGVGVIGFGFLLKIFGPQHKTQKEKKSGQEKFLLAQTLRKHRLVLILLSVGGFLVLFFVLGTQSNYISRMWEYFTITDDFDLRRYFNYIGFGSRMTYWETAWLIFLSHPIFGVGLGNFTLYFSRFIPYQQLISTPQLLRHIVPIPGRIRVISVKQFLFRILAETGLVGGVIFFVFLLILTAGAL